MNSLCRSGHFIQSQTKDALVLDCHPHCVEVKKCDFSVQICTFHTVSSKENGFWYLIPPWEWR